jgi:hypothetical protein
MTGIYHTFGRPEALRLIMESSERIFRCDYGSCDFKTPWKSRFVVHMYMKHKKLLEGAVLYEW